MAPEYAMHGQFSVKSDVFSFGVLILEIVTGKKNSSFYQLDGAQDLLSYVSTSNQYACYMISVAFISFQIFMLDKLSEPHFLQAWKLWNEGAASELVDPALGNSYARNEVIQCIHVGLLCVQEHFDQRPTMASVVYMLKNSSVTLATPNQPPFFVRMEDYGRYTSSSNKSITGSVNEVTITETYPR